jgi:hypothetical protein
MHKANTIRLGVNDTEMVSEQNGRMISITHNQVMTSALMEGQVVSKKRVADHGEVYTGKREVNAMLDLVKQETERIESRFLEPACGKGNFLTEILERKLTVVESRYGRSQLDYERNVVLAVSSLYGIDILQDNALECHQRLFEIFEAGCEDDDQRKCNADQGVKTHRDLLEANGESLNPEWSSAPGLAQFNSVERGVAGHDHP